ncbi:hypothetical protein C922_05865 [Plasmodium inui San Antonio 1]|uniref:Uncharacterized protein n=1 Tax=Plasmodium inui San Antonio 1 TaxID=1237626 RepID=W6ZWR9_9APIC|nr:hypothetical protein C922_05865 [Plasmodium inui San Antonio 1]EUD61390.1 hypothetical protein C922_05865 [Plasmodium inui San Antonio 1]
MEYLIFYERSRRKDSSKGKIKVKARVLFRGKIKICLKRKQKGWMYKQVTISSKNKARLRSGPRARSTARVWDKVRSNVPTR